MTTTTHTPGPWVIDNGGDVYDINTNGAGGPWSAIATVLGENSDGSVQVTEEEAAANARLIAAAPDLLAALQRLVRANCRSRLGARRSIIT